MTLKRIQWFVLLTTILYLLISVLGQFLGLQLLEIVYLNEFFFLSMALLFLGIRRLPVYEFIQLDVPPFRAFLVATGAVFCTVYIGGFLTALSMMFTRVLGLPDLPEQGLMQATENSLLLVLSMAILPGIAEEFYCRGMILRSVQKVASKWQAVLFAGFIFGLFHFHPWNFLSPFFMGIVFGILALRFHSVIIAMYSHALFNLIVLISSKALSGAERAVLNMQTFFAMLPMTILATLVLYILYKKLGIGLMMQAGEGKVTMRAFWPSSLLVLLFLAISTLFYVNLR